MVGEAALDETQHVLRDGVDGESLGQRDQARAGATGRRLRPAFAVVGVEVPAAAFGVALAVEKDAMASTHLAVEELQPLRPQPCQRCAQSAGEGRLGVVVERDVVDSDAGRPQLVAEVAHRREEDRDPRLVASQMRGLAGGLDHEDGVLRRVEAVEGRARRRELVAENEDEVAHRSMLPAIGSPRGAATIEP